MTAPTLVRLPWKFYVDHFERALPTPDAVRETKANVFVRLDDPALPELLDDAEHYAHPSGPDADWLGPLKTSARATVKAIKAARAAQAAALKEERQS